MVQGLLFVKPQPLPKAPVSSTTASHISSPNGVAAASSSQALYNSSSNGADPFADVPTIPELDQEGWVSQVGGHLWDVCQKPYFLAPCASCRPHWREYRQHCVCGCVQVE